MRYFIRSVKYFFHFVILLTAVILALVLIGAAEGDINEIFEDGYNALWKIALLFAAVAAVYPKFGFINRRIEVNADWDTVRDAAVNYFKERKLAVDTEEADKITFRRIGLGARISRKGEDRITLTKTAEGYFLEGLQKDIILFSTALEHLISDSAS